MSTTTSTRRRRATATTVIEPVSSPRKPNTKPKRPGQRHQNSPFGYQDSPWSRTSDGPQNRKPRRSLEWRDRISTRTARRRLPWIAAAGVAATSALAWGATSLFATAHVDAHVVSGVVATLPTVYAGIGASQARPRLGGWWPDLAASTLAACGLVFWVGISGPSWWAVLALLAGTIAGAGRWWAAHPVGPDVPSLKPTPAQRHQPIPAAPAPDVDDYAMRWDTRIAGGADAKLPGSRLTNRAETAETVSYRVELRSDYTFDEVDTNQTRIAGMLGLARKRVMFRPGSSEDPPNVAHLTIVTGDPVSGVRYYTAPSVSGGEITNLARFGDGSGELSITMFDEDGTKSVAVVGGMGGGKSAAANQLITGSLSTGAMNLLYIDPKGNSSTALRKRARVVLLGHDAAMRAPELMQALNTARGEYAMTTEQDVLLPSAREPGWTVMHDEFMAVSGDSKVRAAWARMSNQMRAYGTWMITANQALQESKWGDDATRAALTQQVIAFRINSGSDTLLPGMTYRPNELPTDEHGNTIPGHAVQVGVARPNIPALWDKLPRDGDTRDPNAPHTISTAFDTFFRQPEPLPSDVAALESILGPANADGRWVVGGPGATHQFPDPEDMAKSKSRRSTRQSKPTGFGTVAPQNPSTESAPADLTQVQSDVLAIVEGGTTRVGDIEQGVKAARSTIREALDELTARGLLRKPERGIWEAVPQD